MRSPVAVLLLAAVLGGGCGAPEPPAPAMRSFTALEDGCTGDTCTGVWLTYPEYSGGEEGAAEAMNAALDRHLQSLVLIGDTTPLTLERAAARLLATHRQFSEEFPESPQRWQIRVRVGQTYASPGVVALRSDAESYLGGAHPNSVTTLFVFDSRTGRRLTRDEIIRDRILLLRRAEPRFREVRHLEADESFGEAGFWFPGDTLNLPANIGFAVEGLVLYYNRYEITSYAGGSTEVVIPWNDAEELVVRR